jgi:hypothetical protein
MDFRVVNVLLGLDRLTRRLAEDGAQFGRSLLPLRTRQALGPNHELTLRREGDDHLCHRVLLLRT